MEDDQPDADVYLTTHNTHSRKSSTLAEEFEPAIPTSEPPRNTP